MTDACLTKQLILLTKQVRRKEFYLKSKQKKNIGSKEIEDVIAKIARIPAKNINKDDRSSLKNLERDLKAVIFGQDKAIETLSNAIKMSRSGIGPIDRPIGSFLFSGPTGVGKTEVARQLAYTLRYRAY